MDFTRAGGLNGPPVFVVRNNLNVFRFLDLPLALPDDLSQFTFHFF